MNTNTKAATIKDVARLAGCSIKTVSRVINDEPYVTEETRLKVREAIKQLGYAPNISARRLVQQRSYVICILLHSAGFYQSAVLSKVLEIGYEQNYDILIQNYYPSHGKSKKKLESLIHERRIDGLVTTPPCDVDEFIIDLLSTSNIPLVQITPFNRTGNTPFVTGDDYQGAMMITEKLIEFGHKRIFFLSGPRNHRTSIDRQYGYRAAMDSHQLKIEDDWILESEFNFDGGYTAAKIAMSRSITPTAFFAGSDEAALGALYALQELKIKVPQEVSVCGFDDTVHSKHTWPGLTTVHHPIDQIVDKATYLLLDILDGKQPDQMQVVVPSRMILRGSIGEAITRV